MTTNDARLTSPAWRRLRLAILDRDGWRCQINGPGCTQRATTVDHVIEREAGGDMWSPANLRAACAHCNGYRAAERTNQLRRRGIRYPTTVAEYETRF
jgi:5-methylcytosine-specific restriction enzyme A